MKILTPYSKITFIFLSLLLISSNALFSQASSRDFKNSVKFNVSNTLLYDNSYQFSYERMLKEKDEMNMQKSNMEMTHA